MQIISMISKNNPKLINMFIKDLIKRSKGAYSTGTSMHISKILLISWYKMSSSIFLFWKLSTNVKIESWSLSFSTESSWESSLPTRLRTGDDFFLLLKFLYIRLGDVFDDELDKSLEFFKLSAVLALEDSKLDSISFSASLN